jgi:DNA polymerase-1
MSTSSAASPTNWRERFREEWHIDFEYREDANHLPVPVSLCAIERHSGTALFYRRDQLLKLKRAPFNTGPDSLIVAYAANAEMSCFLALSWPFPVNILDLYVETVAAINGDTTIWLEEEEGQKRKKGRPGLLTALKLHGLQGIEGEEKDHWRNVILENEDYTEEQWRGIEWYNRTDVDATIALLDVMAPTIDWPRALFRGRYMAAVARMERVGLPVDRDRLLTYVERWDDLKLYYIRRDDELGLYDGLKFSETRLWDLVCVRGWNWPRTGTGRLKLDSETLRKQAQRYPELKQFVQLREQIAELRINHLANTVGPDGFSRCPLLPFWTKTGRNQPSGKDKMFLPGLPAWLHGLIKPPPGYAIFEIDWDAQEIGIMAGLSGDEKMIADFLSGDPYLGFGKRARLVPNDATKQNPEHREIRNRSSNRWCSVRITA